MKSNISKEKEKSPIFNALDCFVLVIITFCALYTRLWNIAMPSQVIFDEVHFGNFSSWYIQNRFHFDIHPPLGKMMMGFIAKTTQYKGDINYASKFGQDYEINELFYVSQRITPAIFSAMTTPFLFLAMRSLSLPTFFSAAAGLILTTDISLIVEGKFILSDGMLHCFTALHIFALCFFLNNDESVLRAIFAGITLGAASACKYTALGLLAVDGMTQIVWIFVKRPDILKIILRAISLLVPCFATFYTAWVIHFLVTPYTGYHSEYIIPKHASTLIPFDKINSTYWGRRLIGSGLLERIISWNIVMNRVNMRSDIPHPYESFPKYWPFLLDKYVGFYHSGNRNIYCLGGPATYWFSSIAIILTFVATIFRKADWRNALLVWGWAVSYFPFVLVPRTMFMYHYLVPLMFAIMNMCVLIYNVFPKGVSDSIQMIVLLLSIACYIYFRPIIYGLDCPSCPQTHMWLHQWYKGYDKPVYTEIVNAFNTTEMIYTSIPE